MSLIYLREAFSKWCDRRGTGWQFRMASYRQTNDELSRYVIEMYLFLTRLLTGAILGPLGAQANSLVVEIFKRAQNRIFDELGQILIGHDRQEEEISGISGGHR